MPHHDSSLPGDIIDCLADALIYADREGIIRHWNKAAEVLLGFTSTEAVGQSLDLIIPEPLRQPHWRGYHHALATGSTKPGSRPTITRAVNRTGEKIYVEMSFAIVRDASGNVSGSVAMARDANQRVHDEKKLKQRLAELEGAAGG